MSTFVMELSTILFQMPDNERMWTNLLLGKITPMIYDWSRVERRDTQYTQKVYLLYYLLLSLERELRERVGVLII